MRWVSPLGLIPVTIALACADQPAHPTRAAARHTEFSKRSEADEGAIALLQGDRLVCTAALLTSGLLVTAAHCVSELGSDVVAMGKLSAVFGTDGTDGARRISIADARIHPQFDPGTLKNDLSLLYLKEPAPTRPYPMSVAVSESWTVRSSVRLVGLGAGRKHSGLAQVVSVRDGAAIVSPNTALACHGDSGGPALIERDGIEYLMGVISAGDGDCREWASVIVLDSVAAKFLEPSLSTTGVGTAPTGDRCFFDAQCQSGHCQHPLDLKRFGYCASPCNFESDCASGACVGSDAGKYCVSATPSPGALGHPCLTNEQCESGHCVTSSVSASSSCAARCIPNVLDCPRNFECRPTTDARLPSACFPRFVLARHGRRPG
jgi:hypothetical protein